eukprot:UN31754
MFPGGNYEFEEMQKNGEPRSGGRKADVLICTGWNYSPELKGLHKKYWEEGKGEKVPESLGNKWIDHVWWNKKDKIIYHDKDRPYIISRNAEAWGRGGIDYDVILDCKREGLHDGAPSIYVPWAAQSFCRRSLNHIEDLVRPKHFNANEVYLKKRKFMAFATRECVKSQHSILVTLRVAFFDYVSKNYKEVDALGSCRHNTSPVIDISKERLTVIQATDSSEVTYYDEAVLWYGPYKFVVTYENDKVEGYITEKII